MRKAQEKIHQLTLAQALGFEVPDTLVTNDPDEFIDFYNRHDGNIISKNTAVRVESMVNGAFSGYTRRVLPDDLRFVFDAALCPLTLQSYIDKALELRVTVVGSDLFAVAIDSQVSCRTRTDWRHYDDRHTEYRIYQLPEPIKTRCLELARALQLKYAAMDVILTPGGSFVFLEVNPNGQYLWLEDATGLPISARIAKLLSEGA
jgi:glutathione synthase/RimK-type ligase-like ATP-grasp enzyme